MKTPLPLSLLCLSVAWSSPQTTPNTSASLGKSTNDESTDLACEVKVLKGSSANPVTTKETIYIEIVKSSKAVLINTMNDLPGNVSFQFSSEPFFDPSFPTGTQATNNSTEDRWDIAEHWGVNTDSKNDYKIRDKRIVIDQHTGQILYEQKIKSSRIDYLESATGTCQKANIKTHRL